MKTFLALIIALVAIATSCEAGADVTTTEPVGAAEPTVDAEAPIDSEPLGAGPYPIATLDVTITHPDAPDFVYTISCLGDTATIVGDQIVDGDPACRALADPNVQHRLIVGPPDVYECAEIYGGPDEATITGTLDGTDVKATASRTNACEIADWDSVLADVLPGALDFDN